MTAGRAPLFHPIVAAKQRRVRGGAKDILELLRSIW